MKKAIFLSIILSLFFFGLAKAQQAQLQPATPTVDYQGQSPVDSDLDGLTDQAETQIFHTDPQNPDTDGDGYYDGAEILAKSDPLDANSIPGLPSVVQSPLTNSQGDTPWAWYVSRASGLVGFTLLYISIFLGLTLRVPFLRKIFSPLYALQGHRFISVQALLLVFVHGIVLVFDKFINFSLAEVFVPFASHYQPGLVALGILGFYLMLILVVTSYGRKFISPGIWRAVHFTNIILYLVVIFHAYYLGTDMQNPIIRNIFVWANVLLILIMLINMFSRIKANIERKNTAAQNQAIS